VPTWKVELIPEAHADFNGLDGGVKKQTLKQTPDGILYPPDQCNNASLTPGTPGRLLTFDNIF
jgi:hypothetical protein